MFVLVAVPAETVEPIFDLLDRDVSVAGIAAGEADGRKESPGNGAATA
jgi:hypothetical protein